MNAVFSRNIHATLLLRSWKIGFLAVTCVAALGGCASSATQKQRATALLDDSLAILQMSESAQGFSNQKARVGKLELDLKKYTLGKGGAVTELDGKKAFYVVLELPNFVSGYHIELYSDAKNIGASMLAGVSTVGSVWPAVSVLDAQFQVLEQKMPLYDLSQNRYASLAGFFAHVSICDKRARFIAVHAVPVLYRRVSGATTHNYTQYGDVANQVNVVQLPDGQVRVGIPKRAIGKGIFGGTAITPCQVPDTLLSEFESSLMKPKP
jgi:hypothetical protein